MESYRMYGINTVKEIPIACQTEQAAWDKVISGIWSTLLNSLALNRNDSVIEIGPGTSAKIGLALSEANFQGLLHVIEPSGAALETLRCKYQICLPEASINYIQKDLLAAIPFLPEKPRFLLASHIIDDMLIAASIKEQKEFYEDVFSWSSQYHYVPSMTEAFISHWAKVRSCPDTLSILKMKVRDELIIAIEKLKPAYVIMSQYPSATLAENGWDDLNIHTHGIFCSLNKYYKNSLVGNQNIQIALNTIENYNHPHIGNNILNAAYWMVCKIY